jgi:NitT/TauT family transport system permease protein
MNGRLRWLVEYAVPPLGLFTLILTVWEIIAARLNQMWFLPRPTQVLSAAAENGADLLWGCCLTAEAALAGFALSLAIGLLIALGFSQSRIVQRSFLPYAIFLQTVPVVAIAPIIVTWFGWGFKSVVIVATIISVFPMITGATTGLTLVDANLLELFAIYNAARWQVLFKLRLPNSVPYLVTAAKTSCGLAVVGAIVGEMFAGNSTNSLGLGYLITQTAGQSKTKSKAQSPKSKL